jgi:aryl-alcohol dehydrogenase-like predicted oxidoreductase
MCKTDHIAGLSRAAIFNAVNASLARLETDYIDVLQIHRFDSNTTIEETMEALHDLVKMGKVRYIGASSMWAYQFAMMQACAEKHDWTKFVSMQNQHSLLYREEEREMNKYCLETGVGLVPWAPLYRGYLARPLSASGSTERSKSEESRLLSYYMTLNDTDKTIVNRVEELAKKKGWKMSHVAMAWSIQKGDIPIIGFSKVERIDEALEVRGKTLTDEEMEYLEEPYQPKNIMGHA